MAQQKQPDSASAGASLRLPGTDVGEGQKDDNDHYNVDEFLVGTQDGNGHSEKVWFRANPGYVMAGQELIQRKVFPYRTISDLYRHALVRQIRWLKELEPEQVSDLHHLNIIDQCNIEEEKMLAFASSIERTVATVNNLVNIGRRGRARSLLSKILNQVSMMDSDWRDYYKEKIQPLMYLLEGGAGEGVSLRSGDVEIQGDIDDDAPMM
jgi:hypothetical protein